MSGFVSPLSKTVVEKDYAMEYDTPSNDDLGTPVDDLDSSGGASDTSGASVEPDEISSGGSEFDMEGDGGYSVDEFSFGEDELDDEFGEGGDTGGDGLSMSGEASDMSSKWISDFVSKIGETELPRILHHQSRINETRIKLAELNGDLQGGTLEQVQEVNKNNERTFKDTVKEQMKMIKEPLEQVLKARNVKMSPESALVGAIVLSAVVIFFQFREVKKQNQEILEKIVEKNFNKK